MRQNGFRRRWNRWLDGCAGNLLFWLFCVFLSVVGGFFGTGYFSSETSNEEHHPDFGNVRADIHSTTLTANGQETVEKRTIETNDLIFAGMFMLFFIGFFIVMVIIPIFLGYKMELQKLKNEEIKMQQERRE